MISFPSLVTQGGGGRLNTRYGNHTLIRLLCFLRFSVVAKLRDRRNIKKQTVGMGSIHMAFPQARFQGEIFRAWADTAFLDALPAFCCIFDCIAGHGPYL